MNMITEILAHVSRVSGISPADLWGSSRQRGHVRARQAVAFVARKKLNMSYPEIGRCIGGRNHSTVIHSVELFEQLLRQHDPGALAAYRTAIRGLGIARRDRAREKSRVLALSERVGA